MPPDDGCGSVDELCCVGEDFNDITCDEGLACDRNVQALLGVGVCRECGAVDEIPCGTPPRPVHAFTLQIFPVQGTAVAGAWRQVKPCTCSSGLLGRGH